MNDFIGLKHNIAEYILPRLIEFKDRTKSHPMSMSEDEWYEVLDKMIYSFERVVEYDITEDNYKKFQEGLDLFAKYYLDLWS